MRTRRQMSPEVRYRVMASIRKHDTAPELALRSALWVAGVRGWRCHARLPGTPDLAFSRWQVAVFVDGVWWHGHPDYLPRGRRGPYWDEKIAKNARRDREVNRQLRLMGWSVVRAWDLEVLADPRKVAATVAKKLAQKGWPGRSAAALARELPPGAVVAQRRGVERVVRRQPVSKPATSAGTTTQ